MLLRWQPVQAKQLSWPVSFPTIISTGKSIETILSFADYFLIVAPGVTIKDRLGVLFVDTKNKNPKDIADYYRIRGLVPQNMEQRLENLNARLIITNYHTFEPKILQGNKRSSLTVR